MPWQPELCMELHFFKQFWKETMFYCNRSSGIGGDIVWNYLLTTDAGRQLPDNRTYQKLHLRSGELKKFKQNMPGSYEKTKIPWPEHQNEKVGSVHNSDKL